MCLGRLKVVVRCSTLVCRLGALLLTDNDNTYMYIVKDTQVSPVGVHAEEVKSR